MRENDQAVVGERADSASRAAEGRQIAQFRLTTGDLWDPKHNRTTGSSCNPQGEPPNRRGSRAYVEQFRERIPLGRAIRLKCGSCMGGEIDQLPSSTDATHAPVRSRRSGSATIRGDRSYPRQSWLPYIGTEVAQ